MSVTVTPVGADTDLAAFIRLPYDLYRDDPLWVAPLERERRSFLDPARNPYHQVASVRLFLARRRGTVVGRIAAIVDPRYNERHGPDRGLIGLFECADDPEAAAALFDTADDWLAAQGMKRTFGPLGFTTNDECGVQISGFDQPHIVMIPRNRPYYPQLFSACGFEKAKDLLSYAIPIPADGEPRRNTGRRRTVSSRPRASRCGPWIRSGRNPIWRPSGSSTTKRSPTATARSPSTKRSSAT